MRSFLPDHNLDAWFDYAGLVHGYFIDGGAEGLHMIKADRSNCAHERVDDVGGI